MLNSSRRHLTEPQIIESFSRIKMAESFPVPAVLKCAVEKDTRKHCSTK